MKFRVILLCAGVSEGVPFFTPDKYGSLSKELKQPLSVVSRTMLKIRFFSTRCPPPKPSLKLIPALGPLKNVVP